MFGDIYFKEGFKPENAARGDSFWLDLAPRNFSRWLAVLPPHEPTEASRRESLIDLTESFNLEFRPSYPANIPENTLTEAEDRLAAQFLNETVPNLRIMCGETEGEEWKQCCEVSCTHSRYSFSRSFSPVGWSAEDNRLFSARTVVAWYQFRSLDEDGTADKWILPDINGHNAAVQGKTSIVPEPEEFASGAVFLVHAIHTQPHNDHITEALIPRFSSTAFQEAVEHCAGKYSGVPELQNRFSIVDELIRYSLSEKFPGDELTILRVKMVENRSKISTFHFNLGCERNGGQIEAHVCLFLTATGAIKSEIFDVRQEPAEDAGQG